jgi:hypothetical protein
VGDFFYNKSCRAIVPLELIIGMGETFFAPTQPSWFLRLIVGLLGATLVEVSPAGLGHILIKIEEARA